MNATVGSLPVLVIAPHARCNCRCLMCDIWKDTSKSELTVSDLDHHMDDIEALSVKWVVFSGGEPLMHSDLFRLSAMLRARHIRLTLLSTGLLLAKHAEQIAIQMDDVIVSLDGPPIIHDRIRRVSGAFSQLSQGVMALRRADALLPISARCTVQKLNHARLSDTVLTANDLGLNSISFLAADLLSEAFNRIKPWEASRQSEVALSLKEIAVLENELETINKRWSGTGFVLEDLGKLRRIARHFRAHLGDCPPEAPRCNAPWVSAFIEANGTVRPCFFHPPIGSLRSQTLLQVLNGFAAQSFRASLNVPTNPICKRCVCSLELK